MGDGTDPSGAAIQADLREDMAACGADAARQVRDQGHARVAVPGGGLHVDRPLPFLCVYRRPIGGAPAGAERLVLGQAAHLVVSGAPDLGPAVRALIERLALAVEDIEAFGAFLVVEVWVGDRGTPVRVLSPPEGSSTATALVEALGRVEGMGVPDLVDDPAAAPPGYAPVLGHDAARRLGALILGVEVPPVFVDADGGVLPLVLQRYQDELTVALRQAVFEFATVQTTLQPEHVGSLGPRRLADPVTEVDRALTELATLSDPLLALTPVDADAAWEQFRTDRFEQVPHFHYRPLTLDPDLVKRALYEVPVEDVEDPTLAGLFREKRHELDAELDLLVRRDSPSLLASSDVLYGTADAPLLGLARSVLGLVDRDGGDPLGTSRAQRTVDATAFAAQAQDEIARFCETRPGLTVDIEVRDDVSGVMVDRGRLLIDSRLRLDERRVDALVQHEVGTHVLTWVNGSHQALTLLRVGLPRYDETQEALAVLAEYVVGGLTPGRMATLAARVVAVHSLSQGADFVETFRDLTREAGLSPTAAFDVAMRVHRGGGLTKDVIYLRGLQRLLAHVGAGGSLDDLLVGKLPLEYLPVVEELRWRGVLTPPVLWPRWLVWPGAEARVAALGAGVDVEDLLTGEQL